MTTLLYAVTVYTIGHNTLHTDIADNINCTVSLGAGLPHSNPIPML